MTLLEQGRAGLRLDGVDVVDLHGHLGRTDFAIPDLSLEGLIAAMDAIGVSRIAVSHMMCFGLLAEEGNAEIHAAMRAYPGRILGYVSLWPSSAAEVEQCTARWLAQGFTGVKLHDGNGFSYAIDAYRPAYELANARHMPMLFHTWGGETEFAAISDISARYPETSILLAHSGAANEAGYIDMIRRCPNVYLDLAFSRSPRGLVRRFVDAVGADRITWGSDCWFFSMTQQVGKVLGADISDDDKIKILSTNAQRILGRIT